MKMYLRWTVVCGLFLMMIGCRPQPQTIQYGMDSCSYCSMTIVEKQYGSEMVTQKGKVHKYDAIECLLRDMQERDDSEIALYLVNTYNSPMKLQDATQRTYLVSTLLPSPMGANLTAFDSEAQAKELQTELGGHVYDWNAIRAKFANP